jgi:hypothetical protein
VPSARRPIPLCLTCTEALVTSAPRLYSCGAPGYARKRPLRSGSSGRQPSQPSLAMHDGVRGTSPSTPCCGRSAECTASLPCDGTRHFPPCGGEVSRTLRRVHRHPALRLCSLLAVTQTRPGRALPREALRGSVVTVPESRTVDALTRVTTPLRQSRSGKRGSRLPYVVVEAPLCKVSPKSAENRHRF